MHRCHPFPTLLACLAAATTLGACGDPPYDRDFDPSVELPAYDRDGPRVLFDEAHRNRHTTSTGYRPFTELLRNDGYRVEAGEEPWTPRLLQDYDVAVVVGAMGDDVESDNPAFTPAEVAAMDEWVRAGGALLLVVDHYPFGDAAAALAQRFGVTVGRGFTEDSVHFDRPSSDRSQLAFSRDNGLLADHPITRGRTAAERVDRVATFMGASLRGPDDAVLLRLSPSAVDYQPAVTVQRDGDDSRVNVEYVDPAPTRGNAQALAMQVGRGRVVVMGEAAALTAQRNRYDDAPIGMNLPRFDNRQFTLNVMRWLAGGL